MTTYPGTQIQMPPLRPESDGKIVDEETEELRKLSYNYWLNNLLCPRQSIDDWGISKEDIERVLGGMT